MVLVAVAAADRSEGDQVHARPSTEQPHAGELKSKNPRRTFCAGGGRGMNGVSSRRPSPCRAFLSPSSPFRPLCGAVLVPMPSVGFRIGVMLHSETSYNRCSRSVMASQNLCNSALLRTGPAATPNVSIDFQGMP
jgi:hypothetical protein